MIFNESNILNWFLNLFNEDEEGNLTLNVEKGVLILKEFPHIEINIINVHFLLTENFKVEFDLKQEDNEEIDNLTFEDNRIVFCDLKIYKGIDLIILKDIIVLGFSWGIKVSAFFNKFIIKKDSLQINENDKVNVIKMIGNIPFKNWGKEKFDNNNLNGLVLKEYEINSSAKVFNNITGFLNYTKPVQYSQCDSLEIFNNISKLLHFFTSDLTYFPITIIQSKDNKIELIFELAENLKNEGTKIFNVSFPGQLYDFINSSYDNYVKLKSEDKNIDLLLYYYVWFKNERFVQSQVLFGSTFLEVLKTFGFFEHYCKNANIKDKYIPFLEKLRFVVNNQLNLDTTLITRKLFPLVCEKFDELENDYLNKYPKDKELISEIFSVAINEFLLIDLVILRNQIMHEGNIHLDDEFFIKLNNKLNNILSDNKDIKVINNYNNLINDIFTKDYSNSIILNFANIKEVNDLFYQSVILEHFIELVLLSLIKPKVNFYDDPYFKPQDSLEFLEEFLMNKNFLNRYFEERMFIQNEPLRSYVFEEILKSYGILVHNKELEIYDKEGVFHPFFRTKNPEAKEPYLEIDGYQYFNFSIHDYDHLMIAIENKDIFVANQDNYEDYENFKVEDKNDCISNYYSIFQVEFFEDVHNCFQYGENFLIEQENGECEEDFIKTNKERFQKFSRCSNKKLEFLLNIQRFYYPLGRKDFKNFIIKEDENWLNDKRNFKTEQILEEYEYNVKILKSFIVSYLKKFEKIMGITKKSEDWIFLLENLNIDYKNKLKNKTGLALHYLTLALMLKYFLIDYHYQTGNDIGIIEDYPNFLSIKNKYNNLFYKINKFKINYQPQLMIFVEGESEERILPKIFDWYRGSYPENLGIEIFNFQGVTKLLSTSEDSKELTDLINKIRKNTKGKEMILENEEYSKLRKIITNLEDLDILISNWSNLISYNLEKWKIIPFFISDNEGEVEEFLNNDKIIKFQNNKYNIPKKWQYIWGETNKNKPLKGKDFELANFTDEEIAKVLKTHINSNISNSNITSIRNNEKGINQVQNSKFKEKIKRNKVKIVENLFDNLFDKYEKTKDENLLNRPIFKLIDNIEKILDTDFTPKNEKSEENIGEYILKLLSETEES